MAGLENSVGVGGMNNRRDVIEVQRAINRHLPSNDRLPVDGVCGPVTTAALIRYQQRELRMLRPDGLVEPNRRTANLLLGNEDDQTALSWQADQRAGGGRRIPGYHGRRSDRPTAERCALVAPQSGELSEQLVAG